MLPGVEPTPTLLRWRYGLQGGECHALEQVVRILGISRERVRQVEARALRDLRSGSQARDLRSLVEGV